MNRLSFDVQLTTAVVSVRPQSVTTRFREDSSLAVATVEWGDPDHIQAAWHAGYGGDQYRMLIEHEIAHSFVADEMGWPHSWSLWSAAHGNGQKRAMHEWSPRVREEEHLVISLQRYVNTGLEDDYGRLREAFGERLAETAARFAALARPWLQIGAAADGALRHRSEDFSRLSLRFSSGGM